MGCRKIALRTKLEPPFWKPPFADPRLELGCCANFLSRASHRANRPSAFAWGVHTQRWSFFAKGHDFFDPEPLQRVKANFFGGFYCEFCI